MLLPPQDSSLKSVEKFVFPLFSYPELRDHICLICLLSLNRPSGGHLAGARR